MIEEKQTPRMPTTQELMRARDAEKKREAVEFKKRGVQRSLQERAYMYVEGKAWESKNHRTRGAFEFFCKVHGKDKVWQWHDEWVNRKEKKGGS